jgi:hypothetical protein
MDLLQGVEPTPVIGHRRPTSGTLLPRRKVLVVSSQPCLEPRLPDSGTGGLNFDLGLPQHLDGRIDSRESPAGAFPGEH